MPNNKHKQNVKLNVAKAIKTFNIYLNVWFYHCCDHCWKVFVAALEVSVNWKLICKKMCSNASVQMCPFWLTLCFLSRTLLSGLQFGCSSVVLCPDPLLRVDAPNSQLLRAQSCIRTRNCLCHRELPYPRWYLLERVAPQLITGCYR